MQVNEESGHSVYIYRPHCLSSFGRNSLSLFAGNRKMTLWDKYLLWFSLPTGCMEGIIPPWFHTVSLCVSLLLIYPKSIWLFMCGCWEMINGVVAANKYEIPGSLTGLDWREKCIISPRMHPRLRDINIILSETQAYLERRRRKS